MNFPTGSTPLFEQWRGQDTLSKCVIAISLFLIVFAYLPTLRSDYVAPDQWRAFRYSILPQTPYERAKACAKTVAPYYSRTGRQLLWLSECVEHAAVAKISDFVYLRPLVLSIVAFSAIYIGSVLAPFLGGLAYGVVAASAFMMAPAYAVMYLQGMTGATVLVCLLFAAGSFRLFRGWLERTAAAHKLELRKLIAPLALFFAGCLIYPSWMFVVVGLSWIAMSADIRVSRATMLKRLGATLLFYAFVSFVYYLFERLIETGLEESTRYVPDMGAYSMSFLSRPGAIVDRVLELVKWFYEMPPLNFAAPHGLLVIALGLFSAHIGWEDYKRNSGRLLPSFSIALATFALGCVVLLGSISPWLFSSMDYMATRFVVPWYLFFCFVAVGLIRVASNLLPKKLPNLGAPLALVVFLLPVAIEQKQLSTLETQVSGLEIQTTRTGLAHWLEGKGYDNQRYLLVVRPLSLRPTFAERLLGDGRNAGENAQFSSAQNPVVVPWMIIALLRERDDHPVGGAIGLTECVSDQECIERSLKNPHTVAIGIADAVHVIRSRENPFVINLSLPTSRPIAPVIQRIEEPSFKPELRTVGEVSRD